MKSKIEIKCTREEFRTILRALLVYSDWCNDEATPKIDGWDEEKEQVLQVYLKTSRTSPDQEEE